MHAHAYAGSPAPSDSSNEEEPTAQFSYFVRIINPKKKSDYVVQAWHDVRGQFDTPDSLKEKLVEHFPNDLPTSLQFKVGYFEGRGSTKRWIFEAHDLQTMYSSADKGSKTINLWCEGKTEQDENDPLPPAKKSRSSVKSTRREQLEEEVDDIFKQLKEKHQDMTAPKLRLWACLIQSGHHDDYDTPPNIPLITGSSSKPKKESIADALTGAATAVVKMIQSTGSSSCASVPAQMSPLKAAQLRRGCLEDLKKVKELLEDGVLTQQEFDEEKRRILGTLKSLK